MVTATPIVTGYYRYTDIWFSSWFDVIPNQEDATALKAILAHDALVHPDNPLHKQGIEGIELFLGTFHNGESRLLFSSAQIDYLRYWAHAMKLTSEIAPLPYSNCLLTMDDLYNVSPVVYKTGGEVRDAVKKIQKNNKKLKGSNPALNSRRDLFERVRTFWSKKMGVWLAIDFEAWDRDSTLLTEMGWSRVNWENGEVVEDHGHLLVEDRQTYRNWYVPNNPRNYNFGNTEIIKKAQFYQKIKALIQESSLQGLLFLIFHGGSQDIKYLTDTIKVPLEGLTYMLPVDSTPEKGIFVVDTAPMFAGLEGEASGDTRSLDRMCALLQIPTEYLHNAGNDAHYTMLALKSMATGDPVDMQREKRWPTALVNGVKVQFKPWEEESDYSDTEGVI